MDEFNGKGGYSRINEIPKDSKRPATRESKSKHKKKNPITHPVESTHQRDLRSRKIFHPPAPKPHSKRNKKPDVEIYIKARRKEDEELEVLDINCNTKDFDPTFLEEKFEGYDFENLVFEGGGVRGLAHCGAIMYLYSVNKLNNIKKVIGSSAGGLTALLVSFKLPAQEVLKEISTLNFDKLDKDPTNCFKTISDLKNHFGKLKGHYLMKMCEGILERHDLPSEMTFKQHFEKFGIELTLTGTNTKTITSTYFNKEETPDMPLKQALRITMGFPLVFMVHEYDGKKYCDGGVINNLPIDYYDILEGDGHYQKNDKTLGFMLSKSGEENYMDTTENNNLMEFMVNFLDGLATAASRNRWKGENNEEGDGWKRIIEINTGEIATLEFNLTKEDKKNLIEWGFEGANNFFKTDLMLEVELDGDGFEPRPDKSCFSLSNCNLL